MVSYEKLREREAQQYISDLFKLKKIQPEPYLQTFFYDFSNWELLFSRHFLELIIIGKDKKGGEEEIFFFSLPGHMQKEMPCEDTARSQLSTGLKEAS